ncbi:putative leucine-rich repeat-containing protein C926.06c [Colletotrichum liriopes]|uniref:Leucine-rich repeat-containing protein C926.06c n=1 Tax=Colletotrichum liriopes TaxID=708192 RepID=A0AA37LWK8_9PEZI|nr:putative leucine-rich repeat-containing protein C926.06c [Colletotrichum liriopes]
MGVLPASKWRFLKHLSLADNSMTSIPATSLVPLANTLHSLDLSSNLFTQIPDSLATLTALRALNLSHCMIDGLHSLTRNPLPAISALNLRANRLQSIAGIEKLYPLERLDLRDNRLSDPLELARLTGIPDIREIWVEGNPFARTHKDYRITIFNLFRKTPGYTEDIVIDNSGPTYSERRYLVERTPVPAAVPVVKPAPADIPAVDVSKPAIIYDIPKEPSVLRKERPVPKAVTSEFHTPPKDAKEAHRGPLDHRFIRHCDTQYHSGAPGDAKVIAADATATAAGSDSNYRISQAPEIPPLPSAMLSDSRKSNSQPEVPRIDTSVVPELPPIYTTRETPPDSQDWDVSGEMYRRKIEALRDKVGNGYLSVLSEEGWDPSRPPTYSVPDFSPASTVRPSPTTPRTTSHHPPAIYSGRTLG